MSREFTEEIVWRDTPPPPWRPVLACYEGRVGIGYLALVLATEAYGGCNAFVLDGRPLPCGALFSWAPLPEGPPR
jgi:hypothetical protein